MKTKEKNERLKILSVPAWYPTKFNPVNGIFIQEQIKASNLYNDNIIIYPNSLGPHPNSFYKISEHIEDGIKVFNIRINYYWFFKKIFSYKKNPNNLKEDSKEENKSIVQRNKKISIVFAYLNVIINNIIWFFLVLRILRIMFKNDFKPDIFHVHVFTVGVPIIILSKLFKIPVIVTEHYTGFSRRNLNRIELILAKYTMNNASAILPVSHGLKNHIQDYGIKNNFFIVPNVVDTEIFHPIHKNMKNEKTKMLLVANITRQKGIYYLLHALNLLNKKRSDFTLDIVGDGCDRLKYEELTKKLCLKEYVKFHGLKTKKEVAIYMQNCDFFIQPSLFETFGVVYIEAMACGKPVIATNVTGPNEIINENTGIIIPPKNINALVHAIDQMLDNYENYSPEGISNYIIKNYSYEIVGKKLDWIYKQIIYGD